MPLEKWEDKVKQKAVWDDASDDLFLFPKRDIAPLILLPVSYLHDICPSALQYSFFIFFEEVLHLSGIYLPHLR